MFTIKLYSDDKNYNVLEAIHYNIRKLSDELTEITLYPKYTTTEGVVYRVSKDNINDLHWKYAYIENSSGKTIEHIRPESKSVKEYRVNLYGDTRISFTDM